MENAQIDLPEALAFDRKGMTDEPFEMQSNNSRKDRPMKKIQFDVDTKERQQQYIETQKKKGDRVGLVFAKAFLYGMRDIGYKSPGWAFCEMIDNAIQAGATTVEFRLGFAASNKSKAKPDMVAVVDNGGGMIPEMIGYAVRWGGSDRVGDRHGFGRYGFGLPSSAVSMSKRYTVYSKTKGDANWSAVTVDLDALADAAENVTNLEKLLAPRTAELPDWVLQYHTSDDAVNPTQIDVSLLESGTIVVLEQLDRLREKSGFTKDNNWVMTKVVKGKLLDHFGLIYRHWLHERRIVVDGVPAQAVDPLFLMPEARHYAETSVMAEQVYDHAFEVQPESGEAGVVRIRAAFLPPNFQWANPNDTSSRPRNNKRAKIMKALNGLQVCREGRQIDCIQPEWTKYQVYDYNVKIEVDFDPVLDEFFGITTSKQQIVIEDSMWEKLKQSGKEAGGLRDLVSDMRKQYTESIQELDKTREVQLAPNQPRPSETAMEQAEKFRIRRPTPTDDKVAEAKKNVEDLVESIAKLSGKPRQEVEADVRKQINARSWHVRFDAVREGPFYWPKRLGAQKQIVINTAHPFYTKLYTQAPAIKSALEVLIFVLADGEIDAEGDREQFYRNERVHQWSKLLKDALDKLIDEDVIVDRISAAQEANEVEGVYKAV